MLGPRTDDEGDWIMDLYAQYSGESDKEISWELQIDYSSWEPSYEEMIEDYELWAEKFEEEYRDVDHLSLSKVGPFAQDIGQE